jgi:hypothetical protein
MPNIRIEQVLPELPE